MKSPIFNTIKNTTDCILKEIKHIEFTNIENELNENFKELYKCDNKLLEEFKNIELEYKNQIKNSMLQLDDSEISTPDLNVNLNNNLVENYITKSNIFNKNFIIEELNKTIIIFENQINNIINNNIFSPFINTKIKSIIMELKSMVINEINKTY